MLVRFEELSGTSLAAVALMVGAVGAVAGLGFLNGWAAVLYMCAGVVLVSSLGYLAMTRISTFVLVLLATRSTLDVTNMQKPGASGLAATAVSLLLIVTVVLWVAAQHRAGRRAFAPLSLAGIGLACATMVSATGAVRPLVTLTEAARVTSAVAMLTLLIARLRTEQDVRRLLRVVYLSMVVPLLFAVMQAVAIGAGTDAAGMSRVVGTFRHPNAFGAYLAVLLVAGVALLSAAHGIDRRVLHVLLAVGFVALVLTLSRGSWLATAVGLTVVAVVQRRPAVLGVLGAIIAAGATNPAVSARLADLGESRSLAGTEGNSLVWRFDYWRQLLDLANHSPATGVGLDMAQFLTVEGNLPHNDFVRLYVEAGWIGLLCLLALLAVLGATAVRAVRQASTPLASAAGAGFSGGLAVVLTIMLGGNVISSVVLLWYFFALAAAAHWAATFSSSDIEAGDGSETCVAVQAP